jgi:guanosine-3',5'-bis(diphosphate) 3'-pyrophosphohydrolase
METFESFVQRCELYFTHEQVILLRIMYKLGKFSHRFDTRKDEVGPNGEPLRYWEHVRRVMLILVEEVGLIDFHTLCVAGLHDTVEDTRLVPEEISLLFGPAICRSVLLVSKRPKAGFLKRLRRHGTWRELAVKVADRIDNLRSLGNSTPEFRAKQIQETLAHYPDLVERMEASADGESAQIQSAVGALAHLLSEEVAKR